MKNKVFSIILAVVLSFALWLYVTTEVSPESEKTYYEIPVILQNENVLSERGLMITGEIPKITLQLKGNRSDLNSLNESNINILASVSGIVAPGEHLLNYTISYPGNIPSNAIEEKSRSLDLIPLTVESRVTKYVPVNVNFTGAVSGGYIADLDNAAMDYSSVQISGPQSVVDQITQACFDVSLQDRKETFTQENTFILCDASGRAVDADLITANIQAVSVSVQVRRYMDLELQLDIVDGGGATKDTCTIDIEPKVIRVSANEKLLENIGPVNLGEVKLGELTQEQTLTFPIVLPEEVVNETGVTEATVTVKFPQLKTKTFNVTNIVPVNVPEGMEVELTAQVLEVTMRGPAELIDRMKDSDLTAEVDFTDAQEGTAKVKATIVTAEEFKQVGALKSHSVMASLKSKN